MEKQQTTAKGFAILSLSGIINKLLALAYLPIQTAIVGNYGNGIIASGYRIYIFIFALSNAGLPVAISKLISEQNALGNYNDSKKILKIALIFMSFLGLFYGLLMALGAGWISEQISQPKAYLMILALSPTFVFTAISSAFRGYFQGNRNMYPTAISQILEQFLNSILTIVFAALLIQYGVDKAAAGTTIGTSVGALGTSIFLVSIYLRNKKSHENELESSIYSGNQLTNSDIIKQIMLYSFPAIIGTLALSASDLIDLKFGVSRMIDGGIEHTRATELFGIYSNQFQRIINLSLALTSALSVALIPSISAANAVKDVKLLSLKMNESFRALYIFTIPCVIGIASLAEPIITLIFFSYKYNQGSDLIMVGSWTAVVMATLSIQNAILIGIGRPFIAPVNILIGMLLKVAINYYTVVIPIINIKGAIFGTVAGWFIACYLNHHFIKKYTGISVNYWKYIFKPLVFSVIMSVVAYSVFELSQFILRNIITANLLLNDICVLISIAVGGILYFVLLVWSRTLVSADILRLPFGKTIINIINKNGLLKV